jgi:threonine aldolase
MLGGGMRQAGVLAAAGLIALEEMPRFLACDHANARHLAEGLSQIEGIALDPKKVATNILIFDVRGTRLAAADFCAALGVLGILCNPTAKFSVRMVTHHDVNREGIDRAVAAAREVCAA